MYSPKYMSFILRVHVVGNIFFPFPASPPCQRLARIVYQFHGFSLANFCLILRSKLGGFVVLFWPEQPQRWGRRAGRGLRVGQWTQWGRWRTQRSGGRVAAATAARAPFWHAGRSCAAAWRRRVARSHRRALHRGCELGCRQISDLQSTALQKCIKLRSSKFCIIVCAHTVVS